MNDRKRKVLYVAQKLFTEKGVLNTSIQDILEEAKISKGTFYNYFNSKNECLVTIIEMSHEEVDQRRRQLSINQNSNNQDILAEQIAILWQVNRDQNLVPIFDAVYQSHDSELKKFVRKSYFREMHWIASRFVDLYGKESIPYSYDCAILFSGMFRQLMFTWKMTRKDPLDILMIIQFVLKRIQVIITQLIEQQDTLLGDYLQVCSESENRSAKVTEKQVLDQLTAFLQEIKEDNYQAGKELTESLSSEFEFKKPKLFVIETLIIAFRKLFKNSAYEKKAHELSELIWSYIEEKKNTTN